MFLKLIANFFFSILSTTLFFGITLAQLQYDIVNGNLIQFNDNGMWCWYQDERAVVDMDSGKLILGCDESQSGLGGSPRDGVISTIIFDMQTNTPKRYQLAKFSCDDHNAPAFFIRPDGKYLAMYAQHYDAYNTRYSIFNGSSWTSEYTYDWRSKPGGTDYTICYNNLYYLSVENRMYDFSRANHRAPNFLLSTNYGDSWFWGGQLTTNQSNTYNKGYYKYWSNNIDRIDFIFTEQHPRDTTTSIYHGYIKNGKAYDSYGNMADNDIFDTTFIPSFLNFTKVFQEGTVLGKDTMRRCWLADVVTYNDGTLAAIITARVNNNTQGSDNSIYPDHHFIYCRFDGSRWDYSFLAKAGKKLYSSEADYTGLAALHPNDPNVVYISTPYSPVDTSINLGVREIWKGTTYDNGGKWTWTPITQNSVRNNIRPIVPFWDENNTVLLWCRGTYNSAQNFDAAVVGILDRELDTIGKKIYVDADTFNTTLSNGLPFPHTGPDNSNGASDGKWHIRTSAGNGGFVISSAELAAGENSPMLKSQITVPKPGKYDVWVNFWGYSTTSANWRVVAGLSSTSLQVYRSMACKTVDSSEYDTPPLVYGGTNIFLYQAYVGRIEVDGSNTFEVFVDDSAYNVGSPTMAGDVNRTWYDGISYAFVGTVNDVVAENPAFPVEFRLCQNYPNPFNSLTTISYYLPVSSNVALVIYDVLGRQVAELVNGEISAGNHRLRWDASSVPSGVYFAKLTVRDAHGNAKYFKVNKMLLMK